MSARSFDINKINTKQSQMRVTIENDQKVVTMYSTKIVVIENDCVILNSGGWKTMTTKTAINNALKQLGYAQRVSQVKGQWFIGKKEFYDGISISKE